MSRARKRPAKSLSVSTEGVELVAHFEGFRDRAYNPVAAERYWTIGYGHYGPDVKASDTITHRLVIAAALFYSL